MRILLTGTSGQVGGVLAGKLTEFGEVIAPGRAALDLADVASIPARLDAIAPDVIVNPAAYTAVDRAEDEPELALYVNGKAPAAIARWAAAR
jgi:dTDP-4-dehydrorhamnose reductase